MNLCGWPAVSLALLRRGLISSARRNQGACKALQLLPNSRGAHKFTGDRISADGSLLVQPVSGAPLDPSGVAVGPEDMSQASLVEGRKPFSLSHAAPVAAPLSEEQLSSLLELLQQSRRVVVLTGAGVSTESNIPDYRGPNGAYTTGFTPMTHQQFMSAPERRARYWARSFAGWAEFGATRPNAAHEGLARLQRLGHVGTVLTQNVDRLHQTAGAADVLEMHGTTHEVRCMSCGALTCRHEWQQCLAELNPAAAEHAAEASRVGASTLEGRVSSAGTAADGRKVSGQESQQVPVRRPDGDVELQDAGTGFVVPPCPACGGFCKPDVVFFGDSLPKDKAARAMELASSCDAMLVVGSSLMVWSAFRLATAAKKAGARLAIINVGVTRGDALADIKVEALAGEALMKLATHPSLLIPKT